MSDAELRLLLSKPELTQGDIDRLRHELEMLKAELKGFREAAELMTAILKPHTEGRP